MAEGKFTHVLYHLRYLQARGSPRGNFPDQAKIILFVDLQNASQAEELFIGIGLKVVTGSKYLRGFSGEGEVEEDLSERESHRMGGVRGDPPGVSRKHLQSAYTGLLKSLQQEWACM